MKQADSDPVLVEREFFSALVTQDSATLERVLSDDFLLVDVMRGGLVTKPDLLGILATGKLKFESIEAFDSRIRLYGATAVITGRTQMNMLFGEARLTVESRYTHVLVNQKSEWRLVAAQGTQITQGADESVE